MNLTKSILTVRGMHCAVCVRNVEVNVSKLPGVDSVVVNLPNESATVSFDPDAISEKERMITVSTYIHQTSPKSVG